MNIWGWNNRGKQSNSIKTYNLYESKWREYKGGYEFL